MKIIIKLKLHSSIKLPNYCVYINDEILYDSIDNGIREEIIIDTEYIDILRENKLIIEHYGKTDNDTIFKNGEIIADSSVELISIAIGKIEFDYLILQRYPFIPEYSDGYYDYAKNNNITISKILYNILNFGFNGKYVFSFKQDIRQDYFNALLQSEREMHEIHNTTFEYEEIDDNIDYMFELKKELGML